MMSRPPFGAILAGGRSTRYGSPKALATVAGERIADRVLAALAQVTPDIVVIANDPSVYAPLGLPVRPDVVPGIGALGGIHSALLWAREEDRPGILAVACDMPFVSAPLLDLLLREAGGRDVVAPESEGRRGVEPLCAYYGIGCLPAIEERLARREHQVVGFYPDVRVGRIPLETMRHFGPPEILFLNVNTPEDRALAERHAAMGDWAHD